MTALCFLKLPKFGSFFLLEGSENKYGKIHDIEKGGSAMIPKTDEQKKAWAIRQLQRKAQELGRPPTKKDFDDIIRIRIKSYLGPWPSAL